MTHSDQKSNKQLFSLMQQTIFYNKPESSTGKYRLNFMLRFEAI